VRAAHWLPPTPLWVSAWALFAQQVGSLRIPAGAFLALNRQQVPQQVRSWQYKGQRRHTALRELTDAPRRQEICLGNNATGGQHVITGPPRCTTERSSRA
jgi:hypothetical protein